MKLPVKMTSFKEHLLYASLLPYWELGRPGVVTVKDKAKGDTPGLDLKFNFDSLTPPMVDFVNHIIGNGLAAIIECLLSSKVLYEGPKVFRPTFEQCLAFEQILPRVTFQEYRQPYDAMVIELPEKYRELRKVKATEGITRPCFLTIARIESDSGSGSIWVSTTLENTLALTASICPGEKTLDEILFRDHEEEYFEGSLPREPDEDELSLRMQGVAVNAMMMLTEFGCKNLGPDNPSHKERLERWIKKARKDGEKEKLAATERELSLHPTIFGFEQNVRLHDEEHSPSPGSDGHSGHSVKAHWRRGHWAMQAHGEGRKLRKRIFRKPVLVNASLYGGTLGSTTTIYTAGK